jgi:hypothetical protein
VRIPKLVFETRTLHNRIVLGELCGVQVSALIRSFAGCVHVMAAMQLTSCACGTEASRRAAFTAGRPIGSPQLGHAARQPAQWQHRCNMRCRASGDSDSDSGDWEEKWSRFQAGIKDNIPKVESGESRAAPRPTGNSRQDQIRQQENAVLDAWNQVRVNVEVWWPR